MVARAEPRQLRRFALLRTRPEGLPARTRRILHAPIAGTNWGLAQRVPVALPGAYWLVPGNGYLCIVGQADLASPGVGTTCARTEQAVEHGVATVTLAPPSAAVRIAKPRLVVGVAPDGAREVLVHTRGVVVTAPIVESAFVLRDAATAPPDLLTFR